MEIDRVWDRIRRLEGAEFTTVTGLPFSYKIDRNSLITSRTERRLAKSEFAKAVALMPLLSVSQLQNTVQRPSYVFAVLTDSRIATV